MKTIDTITKIILMILVALFTKNVMGNMDNMIPVREKEPDSEWVVLVGEPIMEETEEIIIPDTPQNTPECPRMKYYTINDTFIGYEISDFLYAELERYNAEWFYEMALAQLYHESRFNPNAVSDDGFDMGLGQIRSTYKDYFAEKAGVENADLFNPEDNIRIYVYLMVDYMDNLDDDVNSALSKYNVGSTKWYNSKYVNAVYECFNNLKEIEK